MYNKAVIAVQNSGPRRRVALSSDGINAEVSWVDGRQWGGEGRGTGTPPRLASQLSRLDRQTDKREQTDGHCRETRRPPADVNKL